MKALNHLSQTCFEIRDCHVSSSKLSPLQRAQVTWLSWKQFVCVYLPPQGRTPCHSDRQTCKCVEMERGRKQKVKKKKQFWLCAVTASLRTKAIIAFNAITAFVLRHSTTAKTLLRCFCLWWWAWPFKADWHREEKSTAAARNTHLWK